MTDKVAIVSGSNKGIGFGIVKELCKRGVSFVYLTARNIQRGLRAIEDLRKEGFNPEFHQLDVCDRNSVIKFADFLKIQHNGIDILINNAAVVPEDFYQINYDEAKHVIDVNYKGHLNVKKYLFPLLNINARVINISSDCGHISNLRNEFWIKRLTKNEVQIKDIDDFIEWFLKSVQNKTLNLADFASTVLLSYRISKIAICTLTIIEQRDIGRNISVNSLHPGFVKTDMTNQNGDLTIEEASKTPVYLALDCDQSIKGKYIWFDKSVVDWANPNLIMACHGCQKDEVESLLHKV